MIYWDAFMRGLYFITIIVLIVGILRLISGCGMQPIKGFKDDVIHNINQAGWDTMDEEKRFNARLKATLRKANYDFIKEKDRNTDRLVGTTPSGKDGQDGMDGATGSVGKPGRDGTNGVDGKDGLDGKNGNDGRDGVDGQDGQDAVWEVIDPCGDNPAGLDEVLVVMDGCVAAYFEQSGKRFLACLDAGEYITTDSQACRFRVTTEGSVEEMR